MIPHTPKADYLGDGVYADTRDGYGIEVTTENGVEVSNKIYLEPEVFSALLRFAENKMGWKIKKL